MARRLCLFRQVQRSLSLVNKKIEYKNTEYSLSGFCKVFMPNKNTSGAYQGPKFFSYKGKTLLDIRKTFRHD